MIDEGHSQSDKTSRAKGTPASTPLRLLPTLDAIVRSVEGLKEIKKRDLAPGDRVVVRTRNSLYSICVDGEGSYIVSGGWFDRHGLSPVRTRINGCTWGGSAVKTDTVAACGLCLEFGNRLITSNITRIFLIRASSLG